MTCSCGARHATYGACLRAKNIRVGYCRTASGLDYTAERRTHRELAAYKSARDQGVMPAGTGLSQTNAAMDVSQRTGRAFQANDLVSSLYPEN